MDSGLQTSLPFRGKTYRAKHASYSGAIKATVTRGAVTLQYVALLKELGPMSDHAAAKALGRPLSSVCSIRNGLGDRVVPSGKFEMSEWNTKRVLWTLKEAA